jgi:hypothetical protein
MRTGLVFLASIASGGAFLAAAGLACDTAIHFPSEIPDVFISARCKDGELHSDWPWIKDNVMKVSCSAFRSCHQGQRPAGALNLTELRAYDNLVGVESKGSPGRVMVTPGSPNTSYLMVKLGAIPGPLGDGGTTMPPQNDPLCEGKLGAVRRWILQGAHEGILDAGGIGVSDGSVPDGEPSLDGGAPDGVVDGGTAD